MEIKTITDELSVTAQVRPEDLEMLAEKGFRTLICNRPDGEAPDQPGYCLLYTSDAADDEYNVVVGGGGGG